MKIVSCGVILLSYGEVLMGHVPHQSFWDIPKGGMKDGESFAQTAIRETHEETGISLNEKDLIDLGLFSYNRFKDLYLYACDITMMDKRESDLICRSTMTIGSGDEIATIPEMDDFKFYRWHDAIKKSPPSLSRLLSRLPRMSERLTGLHIRY
ncbi:NUDIX hydrolase [Aeromonas caviae]|uniref:NUDIX hydrolase n=1 Tax=Aeromonas caviae TaxID=648 RepID=UPI00385C9AF7